MYRIHILLGLIVYFYHCYIDSHIPMSGLDLVLGPGLVPILHAVPIGEGADRVPLSYQLQRSIPSHFRELVTIYPNRLYCVCVCMCVCVCVRVRVCVCSPQHVTSTDTKIAGSNVGHQLLKKMGETPLHHVCIHHGTIVELVQCACMHAYMCHVCQH